MKKKKKSPEGKLFAFTALDERCMKNAIRRAKEYDMVILDKGDVNFLFPEIAKEVES